MLSISAWEKKKEKKISMKSNKGLQTRKSKHHLIPWTEGHNSQNKAGKRKEHNRKTGMIIAERFAENEMLNTFKELDTLPITKGHQPGVVPV